MALSVILRRSASSLAKRTQTNYSSAIFNNTTSFSEQLCRTTSSSLMIPTTITTPPHSSSITTIAKLAKKSNTDDLLQVLDSQIEIYSKDPEPYIPLGFPFEIIQGNPQEKTITLTRKYEDEVIKVEVHAPYSVTIKDEEANDSKDDKGEERIPLVVSVSKGNGTVLEFGCTIYPDEVSLDNIIVRKDGAPEDDIAIEGCDLCRIGDSTEKAFYKYLEIRGIKPSVTNSFYTMMVKKVTRKHLAWLKNVKQFVVE